jgi:hypothetical protein
MSLILLAEAERFRNVLLETCVYMPSTEAHIAFNKVHFPSACTAYV